MNRRTFLNLSPAAGLTRTSFAAAAPANKRERMFGWLGGQSPPNYTPPLSSPTSATTTRPVPPREMDSRARPL